MLVLGVLCALPLACTQLVAHRTQTVIAAANLSCPIGSAGCPCTAGGGCDPGLYCDGGVCSDGLDEAERMEEDYRFDADVIDLAPAPAPASRDRSISRQAKKGKAKSRGRPAQRSSGADAIAGATTAAEPAPDTVDVGGIAANTAADAQTTDPAEHEHADDRQVIYTAALHLSVYDLDETAALVESLPGRYGGWVEARNDYQITIRVAAEHLFDAIAVLSERGVVLDRALLAQDVTAEYTDLESRIRVLEELVAHLEALLKQAKTVELALEIRVALDAARLELEAARAQMRQLAEAIDFSTLTVVLSQRGPGEPLPTSNDPFPWVDGLGVEITEYR